jgi:ERCC4-type nuclease
MAAKVTAAAAKAEANTQTYLVSDTRERHVLGFIETLFEPAGIARSVAQINTGDYLVCRRLAGGQPEILACIERKTLKDFAASFKDGRYENRHKMLDLRDKTGCQLYFFVEGPAFPKPTWKVARIPYGSILSAMTNLMIRDGIHVVQTEDEMGTAQRLLDFVRSFGKTPVPYTYANTRADAAPPAENSQAGSVAGGDPASDPASGPASDPASDSGAKALAPTANPAGVPNLVLGTIAKEDPLLAVEMWARLTGVSIVTAQSLVDGFSVADLVSGRVGLGELDALRTVSGRQLVKAGKASLRGLRRGGQKEAIKVLSGVPGLSPAMATQLLATGGRGGGCVALSAFLAYGAGVMAATTIQQKGRAVRLGEARAERIVRLMHYSTPPPAEPEAPLLLGPENTIDDDDLDELLGAADTQ